MYSTRVKLTTVLPTSPIEVQDGTKGYAKDDTLTLPPYGSDPGRTYPYPGEPGSRFTVTDSGDGNPVTKIVLQDIRVLRVLAGDVAIDSTGSPASEQSGGQNSDKDKNKSASGDKATGSDMLVLEVSPDQAEVIKFLQDNSGQYQVVLRPKDDHGKATTKGVTYDELVTDYGLTMPKSVRLPGGGR
ncbi:MAG: hypothetical protein IRY97_06090 [Thermomicrobiaceae bacterium]|nr:hypothetical protein [Thermomicrobiaceae bacterium]